MPDNRGGAYKDIFPKNRETVSFFRIISKSKAKIAIGFFFALRRCSKGRETGDGGDWGENVKKSLCSNNSERNAQMI